MKFRKFLLIVQRMAGHDVLAITLRAIFYFLAKRPHLLSRCRSEFAKLDGQYPHSEAIPYSAIAKLPYM
jgi:cytochrome P450